MNQVIVQRGRTVVIKCALGYDAGDDVYTSEIRVDRDSNSTLIATWTVNVDPDDNTELILSLDDAVTREITQETGYMDIKRMSGGEPLPVFDEPLEVLFRGVVTA